MSFLVLLLFNKNPLRAKFYLWVALSEVYFLHFNDLDGLEAKEVDELFCKGDIFV